LAKLGWAPNLVAGGGVTSKAKAAADDRKRRVADIDIGSSSGARCCWSASTRGKVALATYLSLGRRVAKKKTPFSRRQRQRQRHVFAPCAMSRFCRFNVTSRGEVMKKS
jgi:hypothetical protein